MCNSESDGITGRRCLLTGRKDPGRLRARRRSERLAGVSSSIARSSRLSPSVSINDCTTFVDRLIDAYGAGMYNSFGGSSGGHVLGSYGHGGHVHQEHQDLSSYGGFGGGHLGGHGGGWEQQYAHAVPISEHVEVSKPVAVPIYKNIGESTIFHRHCEKSILPVVHYFIDSFSALIGKKHAARES